MRHSALVFAVSLLGYVCTMFAQKCLPIILYKTEAKPNCLEDICKSQFCSLASNSQI